MITIYTLFGFEETGDLQNEAMTTRATERVTTATPVWREVARAIAEMGARRCFGLVGGANFKVTHALAELGVEFIAARHEGGAVTMADVAARLGRDLTVASVTAGPGLTNALTGIAEAAKSSTPLLVIAGDVALGDLHSSFSIRQAELAHSVGAVWIQIAGPETAFEDALRAASLALRRKTVVLSLPIDVQEMTARAAAPVDPATRARLLAEPVSPPNLDQIDGLVAAISAAEKPLILAGHGAVVADAEHQLIALADGIGALLATSLHAHGMFAAHPWNLGVCGGFSSPAAAELIAQSDLILAFGASLNMWTTKKGRLVSDRARVMQIDIDKDRLGLLRPADLKIEGDVAVVAGALLGALDVATVRDSAIAPWRSAEVAAVIDTRSNRRTPYQDAGGADFLDPRTLTKAIDDVLPKQRVVVSDGGHFAGWAIRYLSVPDQRGWCIPIAFQSIGLGLAAAIGAAVTQPQRMVVLAAGDGGFLMSLAELETAVRLKCSICILIYNDSAYGAEVHHFAPQGFSLQMARFPTTDFAAMARGFGADGVVVRQLSDLARVKQWVVEGAPGVFVVDARVNPDLAADWYRDAFGSDS
jgi:thiamine pyrophosphate-dependent acetolactate synthase large subunit-like protein